MRRMLIGLAVLFGLAPGAIAREIAPEQAPATWVAYAEVVTKTLTDRLNAEAPPAPRIRAVLEAGRPSPDEPTPPLVVKVWVGRDGAITRVEFPPLPDAQADEDLHALIAGQRLPPPPRGMKLPLRIAVQLAPPGTAQSGSSGVAPWGAQERRAAPSRFEAPESP